MKITSLDEIRQQVQPEVISIPGFKAGTTINVLVQLVDLTPKLLELKIGNTLAAEAQKLANTGMSKEDIASKMSSVSVVEMLPMLDEVAKEALVEPTYAEITSIHPMTLDQKLEIFRYVTGEVTQTPFRDERGV